MSGAQTQQQFLDLLARVVDGDWLANIRDVGPGYELLRADAAIAERASLAVSHVDDCLFIASAPAGSYSMAQVRFRRQSAAAGAVTVKPGSIVSTPNGRRFIVQQDAALGAPNLVTGFVPARAEYQGYEWNVQGQQTAADGTIIPGEIQIGEMLLTDPAAADPSITVEQMDPAIGGAPAMLDKHGIDRGLPRFPGEPSEAYRERIRAIPLPITKPNLLRAINAVVAPYGVTARIVECFEPDQFGALDWPTVGSGASAPPFVPDADLKPHRVYGKWLDSSVAFGAFFVELPSIQPIEDFGLLLDDPAMAVTDLVSPQHGGRRCVNAYDMDNSMAAPDVLLPALGGFDEPRVALLNGVEALLQLIKQGGNFFAVVINAAG